MLGVSLCPELPPTIVAPSLVTLLSLQNHGAVSPMKPCKTPKVNRFQTHQHYAPPKVPKNDKVPYPRHSGLRH